MTEWRKVPRENAEFLEKAVEAVPEAEKRMMFGCPAYFLKGNMFLGVHQEDIILRLPESDREELLDSGRAKLFAPMNGRVIREYVVVAPSILISPKEFEKWLLKSRACVLSLPPKAKKR